MHLQQFAHNLINLQIIHCIIIFDFYYFILLFLHRRTNIRAIRTKNATVARFRFKPGSAVFTLVKILARI